MTTIGIIGGKLHGFEVTYLAHKAGMNVVLVDRREKPLIRKVVDAFHCFDVVREPEKLIQLSENVDAIIPVNENLPNNKATDACTLTYMINRFLHINL
jgi:pyrrolysine biosynthesis protein PylC